MPGLFFELSILLANPDLARQLALRSQEGFGFGRYLTLFMGLFLAFVIGNAFMLFTSLIQFGVGIFYRTGRFIRALFDRYALLPVLKKLIYGKQNALPPGVSPNSTSRPNPTQGQRWTLPRWVFALYTSTNTRVQGAPGEEEKNEFLWWQTLAKQLLLKKYGLSEDKLPAANFSALYDVLTLPTAEEVRGSVLVNASQATGWAALAASMFAPALRTYWFITFGLFLILYGLIHDLFLARSLHNPEWGHVPRLRAIFREFPKIPPTRDVKPDSTVPVDNEDEP